MSEQDTPTTEDLILKITEGHAESGTLLVCAEYKGMIYLIKHNGIGYRCGYVIIPKDHVLYEKSYDDLYDVETFEFAEFYPIEAHGGLTFSDFICEEWALGFDCAHYGDAVDTELPVEHIIPCMSDGVVRTEEYVEGECRGMIDAILIGDAIMKGEA